MTDTPHAALHWHRTFWREEPDSAESLHAVLEVAWADAPEGRYVRFRNEDDHGGWTVHWPITAAHELGRALLACPEPDHADV